MDPATAIGVVTGTAALIRLLGQGVLSIKIMIHGIREVEEATQGFSDELDAFYFVLRVLNSEIQSRSMVQEIQEWWGLNQLDALLTNAAKTFSRLDVIFCQIHRQRSILQRPREYFRINEYDREINILRLRITIYTAALNIPVVILAFRGTRDLRTTQDPNLSLLHDRISELEGGIARLCEDIGDLGPRREEVPLPTSPQARSPIFHDSEELIDIAHTIVLSANSIAASGSSRSPPSTVRNLLVRLGISIPQNKGLNNPLPLTIGDSGHETSPSFAEVPLTSRWRNDIKSWIPGPAEVGLGPPSELGYGELSSISDIQSLSITDTSNFSNRIFTPAPSTIDSRNDSDIEAELMKRRYRKAKTLMDQKKYPEALPHLKRTLNVMKTSADEGLFQDTGAYQKVQYLLATALIETKSNLSEAETVLQELFESQNSEPLDRFSAAHLLARIYLDHGPDQYPKAKAMCLTAVKGRNATLGREHSETYESIALLCLICNASNDSDAEIWEDMLPEDSKRTPRKANSSATPVNLTTFSQSDLRPFRSSQGRLLGVAFLPDGTPLAYDTITPDAAIRLWNLATGEALQTLPDSRNTYGIAISPDGKWLASSTFDNNSIIRVWNAISGGKPQVLRISSDASRLTFLPVADRLAFSPDASRLASSTTNGMIWLWDVVTGQAIRTFMSDPIGYGAVAFSPDGGQLASAAGGGAIWLWDVVTGRQLKILTGHRGLLTGILKGMAYSVAFSPDGKQLASGSMDRTITLWDVVTGQALQTLSGHTSSVATVKFSPDGKQLASGSADRTVRLWDAVTGKALQTFTNSGLDVVPLSRPRLFHVNLAFSPDGRKLAWCFGDQISLWTM